MERRLNILAIVVMVLIAMPAYSFAGTTVVNRGVMEESHIQYRHVQTVTTKWTDYKYITGAWVKLEKGDALYATDVSGNNTTVSIAAGYGGVSVGISVPLGKKTSKSGATFSKTAKSDGKYKIKMKKKVKVTVKVWQTRPYDPITKEAKGSWSKGNVVSKKYKVLEVDPVLVKKQ